MTMDTAATTLDTPLGPFTLFATCDALAGCTSSPSAAVVPGASDHRLLGEARAQLRAYFEGRLARFDLPLRPRGTPFQLRVWQALGGVPFGETASYLDLAARIGSPAASRAVGSANARNPIAIIVPCHRVIGHDGELRGYAGGLDAKRWLLEHERAFARLAPRAKPAA
jgi:methylated-DNA-[protein]-cysteine S-methyltransferase